MNGVQQDKQQRACGKSTGLLGGKQGVSSLISEELWAKGAYTGCAATQKAPEWTEISPAERTCLQACREQVPNGIAIANFPRQAFLCLNALWCLLWSSPEEADIGKSADRALRASHGAPTCPWAL